MRLSDEHLTEAVRAAFEALPAPGATRLKEVEERLVRRASRPVRQKKSRTGYWWLITALAAGGAAAWWAGNFFNGEFSKQDFRRLVPPGIGESEQKSGWPKSSDGQEGNSSTPGSGNRQTDSPAVYRREAY